MYRTPKLAALLLEVSSHAFSQMIWPVLSNGHVRVMPLLLDLRDAVHFSERSAECAKCVLQAVGQIKLQKHELAVEAYAGRVVSRWLLLKQGWTQPVLQLY